MRLFLHNFFATSKITKEGFHRGGISWAPSNHDGGMIQMKEHMFFLDRIDENMPCSALRYYWNSWNRSIDFPHSLTAYHGNYPVHYFYGEEGMKSINYNKCTMRIFLRYRSAISNLFKSHTSIVKYDKIEVGAPLNVEPYSYSKPEPE